MEVSCNTDAGAPDDIVSDIELIASDLRAVQEPCQIVIETVQNPSTSENSLDSDVFPSGQLRPPVRDWGIHIRGILENGVAGERAVDVIESATDALRPLYGETEYFTTQERTGDGEFSVYIWFVLD